MKKVLFTVVAMLGMTFTFAQDDMQASDALKVATTTAAEINLS